MSGNKPSVWEVSRLEYEKLREEVQQSIRNQVRILSYGGTALSVTLGIGLAERSEIILVALPLLAFFFFVLWNVEQTRMMRVGDYISFVEDDVNTHALGGQPTMLWEGWLRERSRSAARDVYDLHYYAQVLVLSIFVLVMVAGLPLVWVVDLGLGRVTVVVRLGATLLYGGFVAVSVWLIVGTVRHDRTMMENSFAELKSERRSRYSEVSDDDSG